MWICPRCTCHEKQGYVCNNCGFDARTDFVEYRTVSPVTEMDCCERRMPLYGDLLKERTVLQNENEKLKRERDHLAEEVDSLKRTGYGLNEVKAAAETVTKASGKILYFKEERKKYRILLIIPFAVNLIWECLLFRLFIITPRLDITVWNSLDGIVQGCLWGSLAYCLWKGSWKFNFLWNVIYIVSELFTLYFNSVWTIMPLTKIFSILLVEFFVFILRKVLRKVSNQTLITAFSARLIVWLEILFLRVYMYVMYDNTYVYLSYIQIVELTVAFVSVYALRKWIERK